MLCLVVAITDGDTLKARCGEAGAYRQINVRIAAIDAPEHAQPFGQVSRRALSVLCYKANALITPTATGAYGRMVADVRCGRHDVATVQVRTGMAWVYDKYAAGYKQLYPLQEAARAANAGLWAGPAPVPPWLWRANRLERQPRPTPPSASAPE